MKIRNNDAQASAVALMLACVTLIIVLAIVSTSYVPVWMKEKENVHMRKAEECFTSFKSLIDTQISKNNTTSVSVALTLGCDGIFLFTPGNLGTVNIEPFSSKLNVVNSTKTLNFTATGNIKFTSQNRYYTRQNFIYEFGSVIIAQTEGQTIKQFPTLSIKNVSDNIQMGITLISIYGSNCTATGFGEQAISTKLKALVKESYSWSYENITINITTEHTYAWFRYFKALLEASGLQELPVSANITLTIGNLQAAKQRLLEIKQDIISKIDTPSITKDAADEVISDIDEAIVEIDSAITYLQVGEFDEALDKVQDAIEEIDEAIEEVLDELGEEGISESYANWLIAELEKVKKMLTGEVQVTLGKGYRIFIYKDGLGIEIYGVNKLDITYAVIEAKIT